MASLAFKAKSVVLPMDTASRLCALGARRGGVVATYAMRGPYGARMVAWAAQDAPGGMRPIGTFAVQWQPAMDEATIGELSWLPTHSEAELWGAIEELAGSSVAR